MSPLCPSEENTRMDGWMVLAVTTDYRVRSMLHRVLEKIVIVKRNMEQNIEQNVNPAELVANESRILCLSCCWKELLFLLVFYTC